MIEWFKEAIEDVRWWMVLWVICASLIVWLLGAPAWVAGVLCIWLLYKENE